MQAGHRQQVGGSNLPEIRGGAPFQLVPLAQQHGPNQAGELPRQQGGHSAARPVSNLRQSGPPAVPGSGLPDASAGQVSPQSQSTGQPAVLGGVEPAGGKAIKPQVPPQDVPWLAVQRGPAGKEHAKGPAFGSGLGPVVKTAEVFLWIVQNQQLHLPLLTFQALSGKNRRLPAETIKPQRQSGAEAERRHQGKRGQNALPLFGQLNEPAPGGSHQAGQQQPQSPQKRPQQASPPGPYGSGQGQRGHSRETQRGQGEQGRFYFGGGRRGQRGMHRLT